MTQITNKNSMDKNSKDYPKEEYIELRGLSPELVGRISIHQNQHKNQNLFDAEIDIVLSESGKIYKHIDILYKLEDEREALNLAIHRLKKYLSGAGQA